MSAPVAPAPTFVQGSPTHLATVGACALATLVCIVIGRALRRRPGGDASERRFGAGLAFVGLAIAGVNQWWWIRQSVTEGLPLQICDVAQVIAALALLWPRRVLRTILYFWAIALSTQAYVTPVLEHGPEAIQFWLFWASHTVIVGFALYDVAVRGYQPTARDLLLAIAVTFAYGMAMVPLNLALGSNYVYTGPSTPDQPTLIDVLGEWPLRLAPLTLLVVLGMVLVWLPWGVAARLREEREGVADGA